ncbi:hypothetical protein V3C99_007967, partial [Haemonchus contortus]
MAPELLNSPQHGPSKSSDIYSFAIVASEVIRRTPAWDLYGEEKDIEDVIAAIKRGGPTPLRPSLIGEATTIPAELVSLVRSCWRENPINRPTMDFICEELQMLLSTASHSNLMDHVFSIMEEYTWTLEQEISDRTKELTEQKKKADLLLSKMLPRWAFLNGVEVAERLKMGQFVDPEGFDSVTVFFSDVVKFTILAAKCTPFQVVGLLNELYSSFDTLIEQHGVYK